MFVYINFSVDKLMAPFYAFANLSETF